MSKIDYKKFFLSIIKKSESFDSFRDNNISSELEVIGKYIESKKGVFTVLVTLSFYKSVHPNQDIRYHQSNMKNGFSGRSFDTRFVTPNLKELGFPSMSESGWLTRSLEQPYPYNFDYDGKLGPVREPFLKIIDYLQKNSDKSEDVLKTLLNYGWKIKKKNKIKIVPLKDSENLSIDSITDSLNKFFNKNYNISGGSKLPVICFYSIFQILINEIERYNDCSLKSLGYHTTSDRTSKSSGDIEIYKTKNNTLFESMEIKSNVKIDNHILNRVIEKIKKFNPHRYYILSSGDISFKTKNSCLNKVRKFKKQHGCEIIIDDISISLSHFLRHTKSLSKFINSFTDNILNDKELKLVHKKEWKKIVENL